MKVGGLARPPFQNPPRRGAGPSGSQARLPRTGAPPRGPGEGLPPPRPPDRQACLDLLYASSARLAACTPPPARDSRPDRRGRRRPAVQAPLHVGRDRLRDMHNLEQGGAAGGEEVQAGPGEHYRPADRGDQGRARPSTSWTPPSPHCRNSLFVAVCSDQLGRLISVPRAVKPAAAMPMIRPLQFKNKKSVAPCPDRPYVDQCHL